MNPEGRAARAGVRPGDVILEVNQTPVRTAEEMRSALQETPDRPVLLLVNREGQNLYLTART